MSAVACFPDVITDKQPVTCAVELTGDGPHPPVPLADGPAIVAFDSGEEAQSDECYFESNTRLVCTGLRLFDASTTTIGFRANRAATTTSSVASVDVVPDIAEAFHVSLGTAGQGAVLRRGRPLVLDISQGVGFEVLDPARGVLPLCGRSTTRSSCNRR